MNKDNRTLLRKIKDFLGSPVEDGSSIPMSARIGIYGFIITLLTWAQCRVFDANELVLITSFTALSIPVELIFRAKNLAKTLLWHIMGFAVLLCFVGFLLQQAGRNREAWYRTNVLEERIQDIVKKSPYPIIGVDGLGYVKYFNLESTRFLGWKEDELRNERFTILLPEENREVYEEGFKREITKLKYGSANWISTNNTIFTFMAKDKTFRKAKISLLGLRFSNDIELGKYEPSKEIEFYCILSPDEE